MELVFLNTSDINGTNSSEISAADEDLFDFLVTGIGITFIGFFGIIGNCLSIFVLLQPQMKSSITFLLLGLTICDTLFLTMNLLIYSFNSVFLYLDIAEWYRNIFDLEKQSWLVVIDDIAQAGSVYFTLAVTLERYLVICWPFKSREFCTYEKARLNALIVVAFSLLFQLSRLHYNDDNVEANKMLVTACPSFEESKPGLDLDYERYFLGWPYLTFILAFPSSLMVFFNFSIYRAVRKAQAKKSSMTKTQSKENSIAVMLLVVVTAFVACQLVFYSIVLIERHFKCVWYEWNANLISMDLFLITVNSSINFIIYCAFGSNFRQQFKTSVLKRLTVDQNKNGRPSASNSGGISGKTDLSSGEDSPYKTTVTPL